MTKLLRQIERFLHEQRGATAVEYAVMLALIIAVVAGGISLFGTETFNVWTDTSNKIETATGGS